jgi:uncharacterized protein (DUF697 family)
MALFSRKSRWRKAIKPLTRRVDTRKLAKTGLTAAGGAISVTAASAWVSSLRRRREKE